MPITARLVVTPAAPKHGDTVTARIEVLGNDGAPPQEAVLAGAAVIGGQEIDVTTTLTLPAVPPLPEAFSKVSGAGLTWVDTDEPNVWTAVVS